MNRVSRSQLESSCTCRPYHFGHGAPVDGFHFGANLSAFDAYLFKLFCLTGCQYEFSSRTGEDFRGQSTERARCAGDDRDFPSHVEERRRIRVSLGHGFTPGG